MPSTDTPAPRAVCHIVTPVGMFGYGFGEQELQNTLEILSTSPAPTAIILDSGSTDSGPRKLASGDMTCPRSSYERDFRKLLRSARRFHVPIIISSAGGDGTDAHVKVVEEIVREAVAERQVPPFPLPTPPIPSYSTPPPQIQITDMAPQKSSQDLKVVTILANIDKPLISSRLASHDITGCGASVPALKPSDIDTATVIVAQMGPEPYMAAMRAHPDYDLLLGGRSNDPAPYVAFATAAFRELHPGKLSSTDGGGEGDREFTERVAGGIQHMGKIMECGGLCARPKSAGAVATVFEDGTFEIAPTDPESRCTPVSVAAHTLYENGRPDLIAGPGGWVDLTATSYEQLADGRTVRVRGGVYKRSVENGRPYQVKLEGARNLGFRYMYMGAIRDPILISHLDDLLVRVKGYAAWQVEGLKEGTWDLDFHVYGRGTSEVFLIGEAFAETPRLALGIASSAKAATIHGSYPGQKATGGNLAFGLGGVPEIDCGRCCEFCVYHLMNLRPGEELSLFPITAKTFPGSRGDDKIHELALPERRTATRSDQRTKPTSVSTTTSPEILLKDAALLSDVARVLRSKNAGPYEITLDVMFDRSDVFTVMRDSGLLSAEVIAKLFDLKTDEVAWSGWFEQALAFKATIPRKRRGLAISNGGFMENDMHGAQMYMPLFNLRLPETLRQQLAILG